MRIGGKVMIKIGDFSKLARISVRMLRHYEKIGLLMPEYVDEQSGYRFYNEKQLTLVNKINLLRNLGFSLANIQKLVSDLDDTAKLKEYLIKQKELVNEEKKTIDNRLLFLNKTINNLDKEINIMEYSVNVKEMPKRYVISARKIVENYQAEGEVWKILNDEFINQEAKLANPCYSIAIFHDKEFNEDGVDIEVQMSIENKNEVKYDSTEQVDFKEVAPFLVASAVFEGDYDQFPPVTEAVVTYINNNDYEMVGAMFSINHVSPGQESDPNKWVTEVCIPIKKK